MFVLADGVGNFFRKFSVGFYNRVSSVSFRFTEQTHEEADIVVGNYERLWNGQRFAAASHTSFSEKNPDSEDFRFQGFFSVGTLSYVWGKLYRKQFLRQH
jgi:hypothetical protein